MSVCKKIDMSTNTLTGVNCNEVLKELIDKGHINKRKLAHQLKEYYRLSFSDAEERYSNVMRAIFEEKLCYPQLRDILQVMGGEIIVGFKIPQEPVQPKNLIVGTYPAIWDQTINAIDLPDNTLRLLRSAGIHYIGQLCRCGREVLLDQVPIGQDSKTSIDDFMSRHGLHFGMSRIIWIPPTSST